MDRYEGEKVVIIGGTSGMGPATAKMLLDGKSVSPARDAEKLRPLAEETAAAVFAVDPSQPEQVAELFLDMDRQVEPLDVVFLSAAATYCGSRIKGSNTLTS